MMAAVKKPRRWELNPKGRNQARAESLLLLMGMRGSVPIGGIREKIFRKAIERRKVPNALLYLSLKRALRSVTGETGFLNRKTKAKIRLIVNEMAERKAIVFSKGTRVDFGIAEKRLSRILGKKNAADFKGYFSAYLEEEANFFRSYIHINSGKAEREW